MGVRKALDELIITQQKMHIPPRQESDVHLTENKLIALAVTLLL